MKQIYIASYYRNGYSHFMKYLEDITGHPKQNDIEKRIKIIEFFEDYGAEAAKKAFGKSRTTIYRWKQKLKKGGGKISALAPGNTAPIHRRKRVVEPFIEDFIIRYRTAHPGIDKTAITPILTFACKQQGIKPISESTVGRIIADLKAKRKLPRSNKIYLSGKTGRLLERKPPQKKQKMRRKDYRPQRAGDLIQMDTISIFTAGIKRYIFTAIDVRTRFAFAAAYKSNSSANGSDFLSKFLNVAPFTTRRIQTDNGSEFAKDFAQSCQRNGLIQFFNYPKHPQSNGLVERFNRTIQEQFVYYHLDYIDELNTFNRKLMEYLIWYNTEKPHRGIGNLPPLRYYLERFIPSPEKSHMYWTLTVA